MTSAEQVDSCLRLAEHVGLRAAAGGFNFVFSPLSIRAALSLAAVGSKGKTLEQMLAFLGSSTAADLRSAAGRLLGSVRVAGGGGSSAGPQLSFVNGVWVEETLGLKPSFQETATSVYHAVVESVDFRSQAPEVARDVNAFVEKATNGLIKDLIPTESVDGLTRLLLANALYFRGMWDEKFDSSKTKNGEFHLLDGSTIQVPFMTSKENQYISYYDTFKVLKLPYRKDQEERRLSMLYFLPDKRDGLLDLIKHVVSEPNFIATHVPYSCDQVGMFMIPKFKISYGFEASDVLKGMGLRIPFTAGEADFTEMVLAPSSGYELFVSKVHHKATIEVDEEGTEASAATALRIQLLCYHPPSDFVADHPFVFAIIEEGTQAVLFLGHVANPLVVETSV